MIVGVSRSEASWWALAWAVGEARRRGAHLLLVHVVGPVAAPSAAYYRSGVLSWPQDPFGVYMECGNALIQTAIAQAVGWMPGDITVEPCSSGAALSDDRHRAIPGRELSGGSHDFGMVAVRASQQRCFRGVGLARHVLNARPGSGQRLTGDAVMMAAQEQVN